MQSTWFWKQWRKEYKLIGYGIAALFFTSLLFLWFSYFKGADAVIHWQKFHDQKAVETVSHTFQLGNFEFSIPIESYITFEYFNGSNLEPNTFALHAFILLLVVASIILLTVITTFERFWYFVGIGLFILFIASLQLDVIRLFGSTGQWTTLATLAVYVLTSYYFNTFNASASFTFRLIIFSLLTLTFGLLIYFFAGVPFPFLHLAVTGYISGMILSVIFIIMIAHEILASFVYLTSQGTTSSKSLQHLSIISAIYMANLIVAYMHEAGFVHWNFLYINFYLLLTVSAILSVWGYRHREVLYQNITQFNPFGAYFLGSLGIIAFTTIGMLLGSANDAALKVIRDFIIFSHIAFGAIFLVYIFSNFVNMLGDDLNVYKVLYNPNRMPYGTYRFAGFIAMLGFVFYSNWQEYAYHSASGFYNNLGDLYQVMDKRGFAEAYYQQGRAYGFHNHHSNYVIGHFEGEKNNLELAHRHYAMANSKRPTEYSAVNEANLSLFENRYFNAIFSFKNALNTFPDSGPIKNNLGYAYTKIHLLDSALLTLEQARGQSISKESAEINFTAFIAQDYIPVNADSLVKKFNSTSAGVISNALAVATLQKQVFPPNDQSLAHEKLDLFQATLLNNYVVNQLKTLDTTFINRAMGIASDSTNAGFSEALKVSLAHAYYHQNYVGKSFQILAELAYLSQSRQGKYNYIMGLWALEQGNPELAVQYFDYAVEYSYKEARAYSAIALAEAHNLAQTLVAADTLIQSKDESETEIGMQLKKTLTVQFAEVLSQSDTEKYRYFRYRMDTRDSSAFTKLVSSIADVNLKTQAVLEMAQRQFDFGNTKTAIRYFMQLEGIRFTDPVLNERIQYFELELLASRGQLRLLATKINEGISFDQKHSLEKMLYTAMVSEVGGDTVTATSHYHVLATANPFYEEGVIAAARYFKSHSTDPSKAYNILTDAIHVNMNSVRLLTAYVAEAVRMGFDEYAAEAAIQLENIKARGH
jgi:Flp pilus assembly protein TadD